MMRALMTKTLFVLCIATAMVGCKISVIVPSGGDVQSNSGTRNCPGAQVCEFEVRAANFSDSFTATPNPGYAFVKWQKGDRFQCGDSTNSTCTVSNEAFAGIPGILNFIVGGDVYYAMPIFSFVGVDSDGDGVQDHLDEDDDGDGFPDIEDPYPLDPDNGGETVLTGSYETDIYLNASDGPYVIDGAIAVRSGATLYIGPGTVIKGPTDTLPGYFCQGLIRLEGASIIVSGTKENPAVFDGISLEIHSEYYESTPLRPVVDIDYARFIPSCGDAIAINDDSLYGQNRPEHGFQYVRVKNSSFDRGVRIATVSSELLISNNEFQGYEAEISGTYLTVTDNSFTGLNILKISVAYEGLESCGPLPPSINTLISKNSIVGVSRVTIGASGPSQECVNIEDELQITNNLIAGNPFYVKLGFFQNVYIWTLVQNNSFQITRTNSMEIRGVASNNYWGTTDSSVIDALIRDRWDSLDVAGYVEYLPILTAPDPATPTE
jgi:hypothetical protein